MADEPRRLTEKLWRGALAILGVTFALWLSVMLLAQIWWVLLIMGIVAVIVFATLRWWRWRQW